jgi:RNA-directed DNA polymerase
LSVQSETIVDATPLVVVPHPDEPPVPDGGPKRKRVDRTEQVARWKAIVEAGGPERYVDAELRTRGLTVDDDPSALSDGGKAAYKERKKAEAQARRELRRAVWEAYKATHVVHVGAGIFFRDEIPVTAADEAARLLRAKENDLSGLDTVEALAAGLGVTMPELRDMCFHRVVDSSSHYRRWTIPKRDGSSRVIAAPKTRQKGAQHWLLRNVVDKLLVHRAAHGFLPSRSIVSNALVHAGARVVVKVDLLDFFPTVTFGRVKGLLRRAGLPEPVAILASLIATEPPRDIVRFRNRTLFVATGPRALPQGAPTSPGITNALCLRMDRRLSGLARVLGFTYTRYADDLTFSWNEERSAPIGALLRGVRAVVESEGFRVHQKKTAVMRGGQTQRVTGLVVNRAGDDVPKARVPRDVVRRLRAAIHNREKGRPGKEGETIEQLRGQAAFVHMVDPVRGRAFLDRIAALELAGKD